MSGRPLFFVLTASFAVLLLLLGPNQKASLEEFAPYTVYSLTKERPWVPSQVAAIDSVLAYGGVDLADESLGRLTTYYLETPDSDSFSLYFFQQMLQTFGADSSVRNFKSPRDLLSYLRRGQAVLVFLPYPLPYAKDVPFWPLAVVSGVDVWNKTVTIHDYYRGPGKTLSFKEFDVLEKNLPANTSYTALVLAAGAKTKADPTASGLKEERSVPEAYEFVGMNYAMARTALLGENLILAEQFSKAATEHPGFKDVPKYFQTFLLSFHAGTLAVKNNSQDSLNKAKEENAKAMSLNHDLDKPEGQFWSGYHGTNIKNGEIANPYLIQGIIDVQESSFGSARRYLLKSLEFGPSPVAEIWLKKAEAKLVNGSGR